MKKKMLRELHKENGVDAPKKMTKENEEQEEERPNDYENYLKEFENVENEDEEGLEEKMHQTRPETNIPATIADLENEHQEAYRKLYENLKDTMRHSQKVISDMDELLTKRKEYSKK